MCEHVILDVVCVLCLRATLTCCMSFIMVVGFQETFGQVPVTSASHAKGRQFDPGQVYVYVSVVTV